MTATPEDTLRNVVNANDKLLKALIALLAVKDEHLLQELQMVFTIAGRTGNKIGEASSATWEHIRKELAMIAALVDSGDGEDGESDGDGQSRLLI
jgi:hypothetical protein